MPDEEPYLLSDYDLVVCRGLKRDFEAFEAQIVHDIKPRSPDPSKPYTGPRFIYAKRLPPIRTKRLR